MERARRRALGAFYTPAEIVARVVDEVLPACGPAPRVLDPACGDGRFLAEIGRRLPGARLVGVERDPAAAAVARGTGAEIRVAEALTSGAIERGAWDVIVGNPPYVRSIHLKKTDPTLWAALRGRYAATSWREWDLYGAFLEATLDWAAPGGAIGLVVPSRWLTAEFAGPLRERLAPWVRKIVHFGAAQLFDGATTYASIVVLQRGGGDAVAVERDGAAGEVARASLGAAPWRLAVGDAARTLARLGAAGPRLGDVARISKGAGSNADPVFLVDEPGGGAIPCARGRDVAPYALALRRWAILPYARGGRLLAPDEIAAWPRLAAHRDELERREGGRFRGERFYRWGRPQNLDWLLDPAPKIVVPDATSRGRAALDDAGRLVIDTAYAIRPTGDVPIGLLLAVLNSPVVATWLAQTGTLLRGGYFRMKTAYLASLPIPRDSAAARDVAARALRAGLEGHDDDAVLALYE